MVGPEGPTGRPGELAIYGDGSAGDVTVDDFVRLGDLLDDGNVQFASLTIAEGGTLLVPSGVTLRTTGDITVAGTLTVDTAAHPGSLSFSSVDGDWPRFRPPETGIARSSPGTPVAVLTPPGEAFESGGGQGVFEEARFLLVPGRLGGGGGWFGPRGGGGGAAFGGGALRLLSGGAIVVDGRIEAGGGGTQDGTCPACSGGGGGIVILAARASVTTAPDAVVDVRGGDGGSSTNRDSAGAASPAVAMGAGGGGGGGCIHFIAPSITHEGDELIEGGAAGTNTVVGGGDLPDLRIGGAGGGASCGSGGMGARFNVSNDSSFAADDGGAGRFFRTEADPTALLL